MMSDRPTETTFELVQAFYERISNADDIRAVNELPDSDFTFRGSLGEEMRGRDAFCEYVRSIH